MEVTMTDIKSTDTLSGRDAALRALKRGQRISESIAKNLDYESLQSFCSTDKEVNAFCQSDMGRIIMAEKWREYNEHGLDELYKIFETYGGPYAHPTEAARIFLRFQLDHDGNDIAYLDLFLGVDSHGNGPQYGVNLRDDYGNLLAAGKSAAIVMDAGGRPKSSSFFPDCHHVIKDFMRAQYMEATRDGHAHLYSDIITLSLEALEFNCYRSDIHLNVPVTRQVKKMLSVENFLSPSGGITPYQPQHASAGNDNAAFIPSQQWVECVLFPLLEKYLRLPMSREPLINVYHQFGIVTRPENKCKHVPGSGIRNRLTFTSVDRREADNTPLSPVYVPTAWQPGMVPTTYRSSPGTTTITRTSAPGSPVYPSPSPSPRQSRESSVESNHSSNSSRHNSAGQQYAQSSWVNRV